MALPVNFYGLDDGHDGMPFSPWAQTTFTPLESMDTGYDGLPFYSPFTDTIPAATANIIMITAPSATIIPDSLLIATANVVAVTARTVRVLGWYRVYPGLRDERTAFTAFGKHVIPEFSYQDPTLIP
jgi:hypothetical protein